MNTNILTALVNFDSFNNTFTNNNKSIINY